MLMRTDPFRELDRIAEQFFGTTTRPAVMHVDGYRDGDWFHVDVDLPGVDPDKIDVTVEGNLLTVRAERTRSPREGAQQIIAERPMGTFSRQLILGDTLNTDKLEASYDAGVLSLRVPIADEARPRKVLVSASSDSRREIRA